MEYLYIEFLSFNSIKYTQLVNIVETMKDDIDSGIEDIDNKWYRLFSDEDTNNFWWPNQEQYEEIKHLFGECPIKITEKEINPREDWDIYSMFDAIKSGEYEIIGIKRLKHGSYILEINPFSYPYGGLDSLKKLIESLGHTIIAYDAGFGRKELDVIYRKKPWWKFW